LAKNNYKQQIRNRTRDKDICFQRGDGRVKIGSGRGRGRKKADRYEKNDSCLSLDYPWLGLWVTWNKKTIFVAYAFS
jgi:hypothetical protein